LLLLLLLRPGIRPQLRRAPKGVAARFFQLLSGHAHDSPLFEGEMGVDGVGQLLVVQKGRQSREHLFKECTAWTAEIRGALDSGGEGIRKKRAGRTNPLRVGRVSGTGSGRQGRGPATHRVRDLLSNDRYTEAVLRFLRDTRVGEVKAGAFVNKRQE
jgi:hypothetical protein